MVLRVVIAGLVLLGHAAIWVMLFNRLHALPLPCRAIKVLEKVLLAILAFGAAALAWRLFVDLTAPAGSGIPLAAADVASAYDVVCAGAAGWVISAWANRKWRERPPAALLSNDTTVVDLADRFGKLPVSGVLPSLTVRVPGNEVFQLAITCKTVRLPRLPKSLDGMSIVHLSDTHFTGAIRREFFEAVVEEANRLAGDLIAITGDLVDRDRCLDWIEATFGRLRARWGVYFVLGNHDIRVRDVGELRRRLCQAGLIDVGGRWLSIDAAPHPIVMAGNECP